jgi:uncharacterized protein (TIGR02145 family)
VAQSSSSSPTSGTPGADLFYEGKTYKTVVIGTQTWMAENLNYTTTTGSWCYDGVATNCTTYGRLYDYGTAKTVCPSGWHLPDTTEWNTLEAAVGGTATAGTKLKAYSTLWSINSGTDIFGFSALPGGIYNSGSFINVGSNAGFWTATVDWSSVSLSRGMNGLSANVSHGNYYQTDGFSVRCLQDSN